jgi:hypothetical protein
MMIRFDCECDECGDYLNDGHDVFCSNCFDTAGEKIAQLNFTRNLEDWTHKHANRRIVFGNGIAGITNGVFLFISTSKELGQKISPEPFKRSFNLLNAMNCKIVPTLWAKEYYDSGTSYARIFKDEQGNQYHIDEKYYSLIPRDADYYTDSEKELSSIVIIVKGKYWGVVMPLRDIEANLLEVEDVGSNMPQT